jgi:hypothetical protein
VHCDLAPTQGLWRERDAYAALLATCDVPAAAEPLAELVNPLVITDDGRLKPIAYDFDARFDVAALEGLTPERLRRYKDERLAEFRDLMGGALASLEDQRELVDWFDFCARLSEAQRSRGKVPGRRATQPSQSGQPVDEASQSEPRRQPENQPQRSDVTAQTRTL